MIRDWIQWSAILFGGLEKIFAVSTMSYDKVIAFLQLRICRYKHDWLELHEDSYGFMMCNRYPIAKYPIEWDFLRFELYLCNAVSIYSMDWLYYDYNWTIITQI
jgi:hypothetical protein